MLYRLRRIRRLFPIKFHTEFLFDHDLEHIPTLPPKADVQIEMLKKGEEHKLHDVWRFNLEKAVVRLERGDLCYLSYLEGKLAAYHWVQFTGQHFIQQANAHITVKPDEGWIFHVRVADWAQGRGINTFLYTTLLEQAKEAGKKRIWIYTASYNKANQVGIERCGFRLKKKIYALRLGHYYYRLMERIVE